MDGCFGFRVQVQAKTLTTGRYRLKPTTIATVIGSHYVSAAAGGPVNLTLTDKSNSSEWQVQLTWDGVKHYVLNGLKPWLAHNRAKVGESIEVFREANDPRLHVLLVRREVSTAASGPSGQDESQQQLASQRDSMPASGCASGRETAAARPPKRHTHTTAGDAAPVPATPVPALHAAGPPAVPPAPAAAAAPATAAAPAEGVQGAQAGPSMPGPRSYGAAAPAHASGGFNTGLDTTAASAPPDPNPGSSVAAMCPSEPAQLPIALAGRPSALLATHAAVADLSGASPHAARPQSARAGSTLGPIAEGMGCRQPGNGGGAAGAEDPRDGLRSTCGEGGTSSGGQPPAARVAAGAPAPGTRSGGGPSEAAGVAAPDARPGDAGAGVAMRAVLRGSQICLRQHVVAALWPGLAEQMPAHQPHELLLHTKRTPASAQRGRGQQVEQELHVYPMKLVRYGKKSDFRLTGIKKALRSLGVTLGNKEDLGLRRLPCGRVLLERWQQQGQEREDVQHAGAKDEELPLGDADKGSYGESAAPPKRRRLQGQGDAGPGVAMRAYVNEYKVGLRQHVVAALWPGLAEQMSLNQSQQVLLHTGCTPTAACQTGSGAQQQQEGELRAFPVTLAMYKSGFKLVGATAAVRSAGVTVEDKEAVGLRRLPCGRVLLERWQQQDQRQGQGPEGSDMKCSGALDDAVPSGDAGGGSGGEDVPSPKRRRLQGLAPGTAASGREAVTSNTTTKSCPGHLHATEAQAWDVRTERSQLLPPAAATWQLWPQQAAALKADLHPDHTVPVTLFTAACNRAPAAAAAGSSACTQQVGGGQGPAEQHTLLLHYTAASAKFRVKGAAGVIAALGLQNGDTLRLRRCPDGRDWAERALPPAAQQQPAPALAPAPVL